MCLDIINEYRDANINFLLMTDTIIDSNIYSIIDGCVYNQCMNKMDFEEIEDLNDSDKIIHVKDYIINEFIKDNYLIMPLNLWLHDIIDDKQFEKCLAIFSKLS